MIYAALSRGLSSRPSESHLRHTEFPLASRSNRRSSGVGVTGHESDKPTQDRADGHSWVPLELYLAVSCLLV